jgi:non-ribosomal peptide synthase protein (TIGR01720 family)
LTAVKETLRRVPNRGIGYGLLRYLSGDEGVAAQLKAAPQPQVSFNYLGQVDQSLARNSPFRQAAESSGAERGLRGDRSHPLSISGRIEGGRLQLVWSYSENLYCQGTLDHLAKSFIGQLRELIVHSQSADAGGYTPSDFADVELSREEIQALMVEVDAAR